MPNPRIDDLRKKLEKEPGSRLFAQLAEELRKDGELAEAIRIARQGLVQHPSYPSARMTLGRALLDSGDLAAARKEFETVLKGAPDNILASRYLGECLEGLGEAAEALARYKATLALAPGDKHVQAAIQALEKAASAAPAKAQPAAGAAPAVQAEPEPPRIRVVEVEGPMELVSRHEEAVPAPPAPAADIFFVQPEPGEPPVVAPEPDERPVPLVPVEEEEFELERSYEAPRVVAREPPPPAAAAVEPETVIEADVVEDDALLAEPTPLVAEPDVIDEEFEVEPPTTPGPPRVTFRDILAEAGISRPEFDAAKAPAPSAPASRPERTDSVTVRDVLADAGVSREEFTAAKEAALQPPSAAAPRPASEEAPAPPAAEPELASPTLAELYFRQGFPDKAVEVYRRLLEREPENERLRARMGEIEADARAVAAAPPGSREEAIGRAIARLQELRSALVRRG